MSKPDTAEAIVRKLARKSPWVWGGGLGRMCQYCGANSGDKHATLCEWPRIRYWVRANAKKKE